LGCLASVKRDAVVMLGLAVLGAAAFGSAYYAVRTQPRTHQKRSAAIGPVPQQLAAGGEVHTITNIRTRPADRGRGGLVIGAPLVRLLPWDTGRFDPRMGLPPLPERPAPSPLTQQLLYRPNSGMGMGLAPPTKQHANQQGMVGIEPPNILYGAGKLGSVLWDPATDVAKHLSMGVSVPGSGAETAPGMPDAPNHCLWTHAHEMQKSLQHLGL